MFDFFIAEFLVLFLLAVSSARVFFIKNRKIDFGAIVPFCAFIISLFTLFIWNLDFFSGLIFILALITMITNVSASLRLFARVYIDSYSAAFKVFSIIEFLLSLVLLVFLIAFRPVRYDESDFNAVKTMYKITGNYLSEFRFSEKTDISERACGFLYVYEPKRPKNEKEITDATTLTDHTDSTAGAASTEGSAEFSGSTVLAAGEGQTQGAPAGEENNFNIESSPVLIFSGSDTGEVFNYEPYFLLLAERGFTVVAADFYAFNTRYDFKFSGTRFVRRFVSLAKFIYGKKENSPVFDIRIQKNYAATARLALERFGNDKKLFFITDSIESSLISQILAVYPENTLGYFSLETLGEYKTPGFGFVEQTNVFLAGFFDVQRDSSFFIPRYAALKTTERIKEFERILE